MAETRTPIVTFLCLLSLVSSIQATALNITHHWKENLGWEMTCNWYLDMDDSLQSVALRWNRQQFFILRPETSKGMLSKSTMFNLRDVTLTVDCNATMENGIRGLCRLLVQPREEPRSDLHFGCSVSGERPFFKFSEQDITIEALVPPRETDMVVTKPQTGPVTINCSSSGIPPPRIYWTVDNQTVPHNFHKSSWNDTSKLWDVWSTFTPHSEAIVQCTPEVEKGKRHIKGKPVQYNGALRTFLDYTILMSAVLSSLLLR